MCNSKANNEVGGQKSCYSNSQSQVDKITPKDAIPNVTSSVKKVGLLPRHFASRSLFIIGIARALDYWFMRRRRVPGTS